MKSIAPILTLLSTLLFLSCSQGISSEQLDTPSSPAKLQANEGESIAVFASGCFWCVEEVFESLIGVREAVSGYAGGKEKNPTYEQVGSGNSQHAEAVQIFYDPQKVSFKVLVDAFFASHNPTTLNRQGPDAGPQYRSIAFFSNEAEKQIIEEAIKSLTDAKTYKRKIVTQVKPLTKFWIAEDYHQDYVEHNPNNSYVRSVSIPRFEKFKKNFDGRYFK